MTDGFKFCPRCATALEDPGNDSGARCPDCGKTWYHNAAPTAGCVMIRDGKALITKRARDPEKGRFDIPWGFIEPGEDPISGLIREVDEELSMKVTVELSDLVQAVPHRYGDDGDWTLAFGFIARDPVGEPQPADDVEKVQWVTIDQLDAIDFAWDHDRELVRKALST